MSCDNYGVPNGTHCACPPGFGGSNCSQPACGGTIFQGSKRPLASGSPSANLTSCACEDGWTGTGCSVCRTAQACQSGFASVVGNSSSLSGVASGQNDTLTCNVAARVFAAGEMSCFVQVSLSTFSYFAYVLRGLPESDAPVSVPRHFHSHISPQPQRSPDTPSEHDRIRAQRVGVCATFLPGRRAVLLQRKLVHTRSR